MSTLISKNFQVTCICLNDYSLYFDVFNEADWIIELNNCIIYHYQIAYNRLVFFVKKLQHFMFSFWWTYISPACWTISTTLSTVSSTSKSVNILENMAPRIKFQEKVSILIKTLLLSYKQYTDLKIVVGPGCPTPSDKLGWQKLLDQFYVIWLWILIDLANHAIWS